MNELGKLIFEAARQSAGREVLPTSLSTAEIRDRIDAELRTRSVFVARGANVDFLSKVKEVVTQVADGEMDDATARWTLLETLRALGYTPEGGFPDIETGQVPPAVRGTLEDLSSKRRLDLIIRTQVDLMRGAAAKAEGIADMEAFPAWELVRVQSVETPRDWPARWAIAGGKMTDGRMIALIGDPVWGELGSSGNFDDALDVDYPPFAFNSGMGWAGLSAADVRRLGVRGPEGETVEVWQSEERAVLGGMTEPVIPEPAISLRDADPALVRRLEEETDAVIIEGRATTAGGADDLRRKLEERRLAREARRAQRMEEALAR
jgi:hypothetical protein